MDVQEVELVAASPAVPVPRPAPVSLATPDAALAVQRGAGNQAVARALGAQDPFALASSGQVSEVPRRREMEAAFGTDFGDVRAHVGGPEAAAGLGALGARAATRGAEVAFRDASPKADLVAHELAHVVQQRRGRAGVACSSETPRAGSSAERAAEHAGAEVAAGRPAPDVGAASDGDTQLAPVTTAGGEWDTTRYEAIGGGAAAGARVGAAIRLTFTPKDPVIADNIGLTQSVKTHSASAPGELVNDPSYVSLRNTALSMGAFGVDPGRAIDQGDPSPGGDTLPNTNPFYAVENSPGNVSASLGDVGATAGFGSHASRTAKPDGSFDEVPGTLSDGPSRRLAFAGQEWRQTFETTALAIDGPLANLYLGSVEWGWRCDAAGKVSLDPATLRVVREGSPTAAFTAAAKRWNDATFTDPTDGATHDTVDLPIDAVDAGALSTADLVKRLADTRAEAAAAAGPDKPRKEFQALALERELKKRNVKIAVRVKSTEDWTGADHVYVKLSGKARHTTPTKKLDDGDSHDFIVPLTTLSPTLPLVDPVEVEVFDEDWPDGDDKIVKMTWSSPYAATTNSSSMDDADYEVTISYEK